MRKEIEDLELFRFLNNKAFKVHVLVLRDRIHQMELKIELSINSYWVDVYTKQKDHYQECLDEELSNTLIWNQLLDLRRAVNQTRSVL